MSDIEANEDQALGGDPFTQSDGTLPYLLRLRERTVRLVREDDDPDEPPRVSRTRVPLPPPDLGPEIPEVPSFEDPDEAPSWLDRAAGALIDREIEERINLVANVLGAHPYDALGFSPRTTRRALAVFVQLYRHYFRVESSGHQVIPEKEGAILACNHGGLLPFDAAMAVVDVFLRANPPRLVRTIVDRWAGTLPFVNVFYSRVGQVIGTRENLRQLLRGGQVALIFPEGMSGIRKKAAERYVLQQFKVGFVEESIRHRVPIIPMAIVGPDDQSPILYDLKPLARLLGLPTFPITPTFPLLGPLGLLPYPVKYEISYGEPFRFYEEFPPEVAEDPHAVRYMAEQVRRRIQEIVDRGVLARRGGKG
jgi:1-acyl-sn-glycerol-3-phosphate acyltransferase